MYDEHKAKIAHRNISKRIFASILWHIDHLDTTNRKAMNISLDYSITTAAAAAADATEMLMRANNLVMVQRVINFTYNVREKGVIFDMRWWYCVAFD